LLQDCENNCDKIEKAQRKPATKKPKSQTIPTVPSLDYKDNYEGDCDDDDYDKEKQDNPNRWKTSITRSGGKHHLSRLNAESSYKLPRQKQNPPRKDKASQKRRSSEKNQSKGLYIYVCLVYLVTVMKANRQIKLAKLHFQ
jgi:hypothetical protein